MVPPSLDSVTLGATTTPLVRSRGGLNESCNSGSVRLDELLDSYSGCMVAIDNTGDNVMMIDDTSDGDDRWCLNNGTIAGNRESGCRGGLVRTRVRRDEGIVNGDIAIR